MPVSEIQLRKFHGRLSACLSAGGDLRALLGELLEPLMRLCNARAGAVFAAEADGAALCQIGVLELAPAAPCGDGVEQAVAVLPLSFRGRSYGEYRFWPDGAAPPGEQALALRQSLCELLGLVLHQAHAQEASRQAVLAEVHDGVAQTLVFAHMRLPLLEEALSGGDAERALRCCADLRQALGQAQANLRTLMARGRAGVDPRGLKHALRSSADAFQQRTQVDLVFEDHAPGLRLDAESESEVHMIVQEALANVAKHARARHAWLRIGQQGGQVDVVVEDDGAGPPAQSSPAPALHFGLDIMRRRAARLGGGVEIAPREGGGMRMRLSFPAGAAPGPAS